MTADKTRRLGRGLEALIPNARATPSDATAAVGGSSELQQIPLRSIRENPYQPRKEFPEEELAELETSIRENGLLQPITVRRSPTKPGEFELVAGERRMRAATRLGWKEIPALVRDLDDRMLLTLALVENLQRTDLNPLEQAEGFRRLVVEFGLTQQQVSELVGKERSTVANMLRLLELPLAVRRLVQESQLTMGHARALLAVHNPELMTQLAREVVAKGLSVRDVESRARAVPSPKTERARKSGDSPNRPAEVRRLEDLLKRRFQTDVRIELSAANRGAVRIPFYSADDFDRVMEFLHPGPRENS